MLGLRGVVRVPFLGCAFGACVGWRIGASGLRCLFGLDAGFAFAGVYIVLSVLMHMRNGQWLTAAGPFKVSESMRKLTSGVDTQNEQLQLAILESARLKTTVATLSSELRTSQRLLEQAQAQLRKKA